MRSKLPVKQCSPLIIVSHHNAVKIFLSRMDTNLRTTSCSSLKIPRCKCLCNLVTKTKQNTLRIDRLNILMIIRKLRKPCWRFMVRHAFIFLDSAFRNVNTSYRRDVSRLISKIPSTHPHYFIYGTFRAGTTNLYRCK